jgi:hypothetical protein
VAADQQLLDQRKLLEMNFRKLNTAHTEQGMLFIVGKSTHNVQAKLL